MMAERFAWEMVVMEIDYKDIVLINAELKRRDL